MIDQIFDACVRLLVFLANNFGITYKAINVWIFVVLWPIVTGLLIVCVFLQQIQIRKLTRQPKVE
jgi:hypothetical protein